jgi:hypothetical protein
MYQSARDGDATLLISHSRLTDNRVVGGAAGAGGKGGMALGGAIENLDNTTTPGLHSARLTVSHCLVAGNDAHGGAGSTGGDGAGGGIANQDGAVLVVSHTLLFDNLARGGDGGLGGNGLGGGLYVSGGSVSVVSTAIRRNQAEGGDGGSGGSDGQGIGGGLYIAGGSVVADHAKIKHNHASASDDDVFGVLTLIERGDEACQGDGSRRPVRSLPSSKRSPARGLARAGERHAWRRAEWHMLPVPR